MIIKKLLIVLLAIICVSSTANAEVRLPQLFQSGMIMQRGKPIPVWGWAEKGEQVTITFQKKTYTTTADDQGRWRIDLPKMKAGGPYVLVVKGERSEAKEITDILIGDVWLLSGQSNIDVTIERVYPQYVNEIDQFNIDHVRLFRVQNETSTHGVKDDIRQTNINWKPLTKQNAWLFSAVGSFLGKHLFEKNKVPQGIIVNSWGGTPIEAWISADSLQKDYPMLVKRVTLYQNDNYVKAQMQANSAASRQWNEMLNKEDRVEAYAASSCQDDDWLTINQDNWSLRHTGSVWLRQHININKVHAGKPARLLLGTLYDQDVTYLNGQQIGSTGYQYPPRRYDIPEGLLKEGDNVIAIRFINKNGAVHFIPQKPYMLCFGDDRLSQNPMPKDVIEAARMDGANELQVTRRIKIPLLMPTILMVTIVTMIGSMRVFDTIRLMTDGGPEGSTMVLVYYIYHQAFKMFNTGYASAIAVILFMIVLILTIIQWTLRKKVSHYED